MPAARRGPLTDFETGGLVSRREGTLSAQFQAWLASLPAANAVFVCVEDGLHRPSDPVLRSLEQRVFFYGDSVFTYGPPEFAELGLLLGGATWNPSVGIVTDVPAKPLPDREYIEQRELMQLAANTMAVVIGAWDDEGLVIWEPS
jgi:hypothetical protein